MVTAAQPALFRFHVHRDKMRAWVRARLWAQVLAGMVLGIVVGLCCAPSSGWVASDTARALVGWFALPGRLFLGLIAIVLIPLVFASIVGGLAGVPSGTAMKRLGLRLGGFILVTTVAAAAIGVFLVGLFEPGSAMDMAAAAPLPPPAGDVGSFDLARLPDLVARVLPTNPGAAIVDGDLMAVVILAVLVGVAASQLEEDRARPLLKLLDSLLAVSMTVVKWAMMLSPLAVFGLMAQLMIQIGAESLLGLLGYVGTVMLGLVLLFALYMVLIGARAGVSPRDFLDAAGETLLLAFSTSSSSAVMPGTIQVARRLGAPGEIARLVVPVGATMNMAGTALYQSIAILFLAQMSGVVLGGGQIALLVATLVATSIGAPGTPGVSIAILASVAQGFGIPAGGLVIILGVDRLLDMCRTVVNVTGDITATVLLRHALD